MNNYNILLAGGEATPGALCCAATIMWHWNSLAKGENLSGRHFNYPPDGSHGSWYGHFKGSLENPFPETDQIEISQSEKPLEPEAEPRPCHIPKALGNAIRQVLDSHPEGISISELRSELKRNNIVVDKDYFGHKKFSHLLLSMPSILRFRFSPGDPQPLVHGVHQSQVTNNPHPILKPIPRDDGKSFTVPLKVEEKHIAAGECLLHKGTDGNVVTSCNEDNKKSVESLSIKQEVTAITNGILGRLWNKLSEMSVNKTKITGNIDASHSFSSFGKSFIQPKKEESKKEKKDSGSDSEKDENSQKSGFLTQVFNWLGFRKASSRDFEEHQNAEHSGEGPSSLPIIHPESHNLFLKSHFWDSMESFLGTSKGSDLVSKSKTRYSLSIQFSSLEVSSMDHI